MSAGAPAPGAGKSARVVYSSPSPVQDDGDKNASLAWWDSDDDLLIARPRKKAVVASLWDSIDDDDLPSDPEESTPKRRRELEAQRILAQSATQPTDALQMRASLLGSGKGKAASGSQPEKGKLNRVAKRYGPPRDPRASLPVTSLQNPIDLTRSDSEEVSGPPVPPVPPAGPTAPVNAPVIPAEATQSPHKRRRARHAKKTINAGVTEERMKAAAKRLADSLERGKLDQHAGTRSTSSSSPGSGDKTPDEKFRTTVGKQESESPLPAGHGAERGSLRDYLLSTPGMPSTPTPAEQVTSSVLALQVAAAPPGSAKHLPSVSGSRQEDVPPEDASAPVKTTPARLLNKSASSTIPIEAKLAQTDGTTSIQPAQDSAPRLLQVKRSSQSEGGGSSIPEASANPMSTEVLGADRSRLVDKPETSRPTRNESGASLLQTARPPLSLDNQHPLAFSPKPSLTKEPSPAVDATLSAPNHKSSASPVTPSEPKSHSVLTSLLGGLSPRTWKAQRLAQKLSGRQQTIQRQAEQGEAAQAADILADLEAKDRRTFGEAEDIRTESDVSSFLDRAVGSCHPSYEPGISSNSDNVTGECVYSVSTSVASPRPAQQFNTSLHDMINNVPENQRNYHLLKTIFESYVAERTCVDEPDADEIKIFNIVDSQPKPPPFEFQYSNQIHYAEGVGEPLPSQGCDCIGPCDPLSDTCKCALRQTLYLYGTVTKGFAYDDGKLRHLNNISIWECSDACDCPPECGNRVIQRGRSRSTNIEIFKTHNKGWGVRAGSVIKPGTFVGVYAGEIIREAESEIRAHVYNKAGRTYLFDLDGYQIRNPPAGLENVDPQTAELAYAAQKDALAWAIEVAEEGETPSTSGYSTHSVDAFHWGNFSRFFNHSCDPNLVTVQAYVKDFHPERPILAVFARRKIVAGEELCISYHGLQDDDEADDEPLSSKPMRSRAQIAHVVAPKDNGSRASEAERQLHINDRCRCGTKKCTGYLFNVHKQG